MIKSNLLIKNDFINELSLKNGSTHSNAAFYLCLILLVSAVKVSAQVLKKPLPIKTIELVHSTHTDYGFTDNPVITQELQKRYLDIALDAIIETSRKKEGQKFYWTAEALDCVSDWWKDASARRRVDFISAVKSGQMDINALPFNAQPFANARQWNTMLHWVPDKLWKQLNPKIGIQDDVNGFPRAAAIGLLNKGIHYIWSGSNPYWGGPPFKESYAFWWKMPDGRKLLVWVSNPYWYGYNLFTERDWRLDQREASNTQFRTPRKNDILSADEKSVREANRICVKKLQQMVDEGYSYDFIAVSITNQWRIDNDGPFPPIIDFVEEWNKLGLQPSIHLTTASKELETIEQKWGKKLKTYEGEWLDWWTFGSLANPRELAATRLANNYVEAALSSVWGTATPALKNNITGIDHDLCRYYEHTYASNEATSRPYSLFNLGSMAEKSIYAYRPYEKSKFLLSQLIRKRFTNEPEGLYVTNTGQDNYSGWVELDKLSFRGKMYKSIINYEKGEKLPLIYDGNTVRFWVENMPPNSFYRFKLTEDSLPAALSGNIPSVKTDSLGWPVEVKWNEMTSPLFTESLANFMSFESKIGRNVEPAIGWETDSSDMRRQKVKKVMKEEWAKSIETATRTETPYSIIYQQKISHPRLKLGIRTLEIWKNEPRVQVGFKYFRLSSSNPEIFYLVFPLPENNAFPVSSNGGIAFQPYKEQLPNTCTDYFTIDSWVNYPSSKGSWIWASRETPLISFDSPQLGVKSMVPPKHMNTILAMLYNNMWDVNYLDDSPGDMEFHFDLVWKNGIIDEKQIQKMVQTYFLRPAVMLNPIEREDKHTFQRMTTIK